MMRSTGLLLGCLGLLAASIVAELADKQALASANAAIAELDQRAAAADHRAHDAAQRIAIATKEARQLEKSLAELTRTSSTPVAPSAPARAATSAFAIEWAMRWEKQLQDPAAQNANLAVARAHLREKFAPLYRALHLTVQQITAFEDNQAIYLAKESDLNAALMEQRIGVQDPIAQKLFGQLAVENNEAQRAVLGEGFAAFREFERTQPVRDLVSRFAGAATVMGDPLNSTQLDGLVGVIAAADAKYAKGEYVGPNVEWERALADAQAVLSPTQLEILRHLDAPGGGRLWAVFNTALSKGVEADRKANPAAPAH